nr:MAG TPA: hypothetical protein [Caudoviricetes sp.]
MIDWAGANRPFHSFHSFPLLDYYTFKLRATSK